MKIQKWLLIGSGIILVGVVAVAVFSYVAPFARAQGPGGGSGPMFDGDFGPMFGGGFGPGRGRGQGMMPGGGFGFGMGPGGGPGQMGMGDRWGGPENSLISIAAEQLGMTTDELLTELQAGKTIADVAAEKNVALETIVDAVVAAHSERLDEQVANGRLTQEQADAMIEQMKTHLADRLDEAMPAQGFGPGMGGRFGGGPGENPMIGTVAEQLGLTTDELFTELRDGKSVADVVKEKNVAVRDIADALLAERADRLNALVTDGQLTQAEVDSRLSNLRVDLIERLNQSRNAGNMAPDAGPDQSGGN